jgi:choline dehydrogenase
VHDPEYDTFEAEYHGTDGPWRQSYHHFSATTKAFIKTNVDMGLPHTPDPNGSSVLGVARMQTSINADATRCSTSSAYLRPDVVPGGGTRGHVRVVLRAHVERILFETKDGVPTAIGAEFRDDKDGMIVNHSIHWWWYLGKYLCDVLCA